MRKCVMMVFAFIVTYAGCVYDYPMQSDKFSAIQKQIFSKHCLGACHIGGLGDLSAPSGLLSLQPDSSYQQLLFNHPIQNDSALSVKFRALVVPSKPDSSFLVTKITLGAPNGFGDPMPSRHERLPQDQIDAIISWIKRGAPND